MKKAKAKATGTLRLPLPAKTGGSMRDRRKEAMKRSTRSNNKTRRYYDGS